MDDPYEILGVEKTADKAEISRAYKRKAKKAHPDTGGSSEEMAKLSSAHLVLSDPVRRKRFDDTGTADAEPDNLTASAVNNITSALNSLLCSERDVPDYKKALVAIFERRKVEIAQARAPLDRAIKRAEKVKARWKRKKKATGEDFIGRAIDAQVEAHKGVLAKIERDVRVLDRCIEILEGYTYSADTTAPSSLNTMFLDVGGVLRF